MVASPLLHDTASDSDYPSVSAEKTKRTPKQPDRFEAVPSTEAQKQAKASAEKQPKEASPRVGAVVEKASAPDNKDRSSAAHAKPSAAREDNAAAQCSLSGGASALSRKRSPTASIKKTSTQQPTPTAKAKTPTQTTAASKTPGSTGSAIKKQKLQDLSNMFANSGMDLTNVDPAAILKAYMLAQQQQQKPTRSSNKQDASAGAPRSPRTPLLGKRASPRDKGSRSKRARRTDEL
jgi:hypothetical protein